MTDAVALDPRAAMVAADAIVAALRPLTTLCPPVPMALPGHSTDVVDAFDHFTRRSAEVGEHAADEGTAYSRALRSLVEYMALADRWTG
jgi:hypothetical protein